MSYFCCCFAKKGSDPLIDNNGNSGRRIIAKKSTFKGRDIGYEPPALDISGTSGTHRLSLSTAPGQLEYLAGPLPGIHERKSGFLRKKGHVMKNWKKRFFNLQDSILSYYSKSIKSNSNEVGDEQTLKGWLNMEGCKVSITRDNPCRLLISSPDANKGLMLETETPSEAEEWKSGLGDAVRAANINSLVGGYRIPQVVQWYIEQHASYLSSIAILEFGNAFKLHFVESNTGTVQLVKVWLQASSDAKGLSFHLSPDNAVSGVRFNRSDNNTSLARTPLQKRIDGLEVSFHAITSITKGTRENVTKSNDMGPDSAFFTFKTTGDTVYVLESEARSKRDQWSHAVRDVINFVHIPIPHVRNIGGALRNPKAVGMSET